LIEQIGTELTRHGVAHEYNSERFSGTHHHNICNRGRFRRGVQLELSRGVRDSDVLRSTVSAAVRSAIEQKKPGEARELPLP
jgi:phage replication-related protein YjqB (UPF0714/DUF867 family)